MTRKLKIFSFYFLLVAIGIGTFLYIRTVGENWFPSDAPLQAGKVQESINHLVHVLITLIAVIVTAQIVGRIFENLGQPIVIGEIIGGIILGPSLLGRVAPDLQNLLLPPETAPFLGIISQLGIILYMFMVGFELDLKVLKKSGHATITVSHAGMVIPFVLGAALALGLYTELAPVGVPFTNFALFLGVSMSITAFPVLARILSDRQLDKSSLGTMALASAAVNDATAWCLLALVVAISHGQPSDALVTLFLTIVFILGMLFVIRPLVERAFPWLEKLGMMTQRGLATIFVAALLSAVATELIGIHAIFGAFILGAIVPRYESLEQDLTAQLQDLLKALFLPAFFAFTGMRTQLNLLNSTEDWIMCGMIIVVACLGKFGGTLMAARWSGLTWRDSSALGILMNTRGLVELIVLNIGFDLGIISPRLFTMLVVMALVTTFMTSPLLSYVLGKNQLEPGHENPA